MSHQETQAVVSLPLPALETAIRDVEHWPLFLKGLEKVSRTGHERYCFSIRQGRALYEVPVCVRADLREHRISWRQLTGPAYAGEFRLAPAGTRRTKVRLSLTDQPRGMGAAVTEMLDRAPATAVLDLQGLERHLRQEA